MQSTYPVCTYRSLATQLACLPSSSGRPARVWPSRRLQYSVRPCCVVADSLQQELLVSGSSDGNGHGEARGFANGTASSTPVPLVAQGTDRVSRLLWDSVNRPLLRIGKGGVQPSHSQSLRELLSAHPLVKVQVNADPSKVDPIAQQLVTSAGGQLLQGKGRTLLFGAAGKAERDLIAAAQQAGQRKSELKQRKQNDQLLRREGPPPLHPDVEQRLNTLRSAGVIFSTDFDAASLRDLSQLPPPAALGILDTANKTKMRTLKNKAAWLTAECRKAASKQARNQKQAVRSVR